MDKKLQIIFYGGVGTVTGANFLLSSPKTKILIDCGLLQGTPDAFVENKRPFDYDVKSMDFLFITHAHLDHIGRVGKLVHDGLKLFFMNLTILLKIKRFHLCQYF